MMLPVSLLAASATAAALTTLTPGPAFLMMLGIGASQGRRAGAGFVFGHLAGDLLWSSLALVAIIGARSAGGLAFDVLGTVCGLYLGWLGLRAVASTRRDGAPVTPVVRRPWLRGVLFGLTNPKGYPVAVATFTALLAGHSAVLHWAAMPQLLIAAVGGFLLADVVLVVFVGTTGVRRLYRRHEIWVVRAAGLIFLGFAALSLLNAAPGLRRAWVGR
jgi:threonine/homoserine/homoserine lactone efflux protein